jgi:hypothetical protein
MAALCAAGLLAITAVGRAETATFTFAPVGSFISAFLPSDSPLLGKEIVSTRIYLDVECFPGSDASNFFTDMSFPIEPFPGNTNAIVLFGSDLGWSGSGTFHYFEETTRFNGVFLSTRYGGETTSENFDGVLLDTSRIEFDYISDGGEDLALQSAASRKGQGNRMFDVDLPLTGDIGIESRSGTRKSELVFSFNNEITAVGGAMSTCGEVRNIRIDPSEAHTVLVRLKEDCNAAVVTVTLTGVTDSQGHTLDSVAVAYGILYGDVTSDGTVDDNDVAAVRAQEGERTNRGNFRADIDADSKITIQDANAVKSYRGTSLP